MEGKVVAICKSKEKGTKKIGGETGYIKENFGLLEDAHASSDTSRQVSLLALESIEKMRQKGLEVSYGDFGENITTEGIELTKLPIGSHIQIGNDVILEVTAIGKSCPSPCNIYYQMGTCIMPLEGVFAKVKKGGEIMVGDKISLWGDEKDSCRD